MSCRYCNSSYANNPDLKKVINICGHSLCVSCVDWIFWRGIGNCPECDQQLRKNDFRLQVFEDEEVDRAVHIRKQISNIYNRTDRDFNTLQEYNNYLEEVENIIYNLRYRIDVEKTTQKIEEYKRLHYSEIQQNRNKISTDQMEVEALYEVEQLLLKRRRLAMAEAEEVIENKRKKIKETFLEKLRSSDTTCLSDTLKEFKELTAELNEEKKKIPESKNEEILTDEDATKLALMKEILSETSKPGSSSAFKYKMSSAAKMFRKIPVESGVLYKYECQKLEGKIPLPVLNDGLGRRYLNFLNSDSKEGLAGGHTQKTLLLKMLQDAFFGF